MSDEAREAATRIVGGWQRSLTGGYFEEGDPLTVARAYLDAAAEIERLRGALSSALHALKMDAPHRSEIEEISAAFTWETHI